MDEILLSVLVPTYNRYQYLKGCLVATTNIKTRNIEIIVQDNTAENSEIVSFIKELNDSRIKYYHIKEHISVSDNCDQAMSHASGKFICMIGDDDTICESIIDAVRFCIDNDIDAANAMIPGFNWPDMKFIGKKEEANLFLRDKADGNVYVIDAKKQLESAVLSAEGLLEKMPKVYHGIVSKACMDRVFEMTGSYFPGPSPDMGNAAAVCLVANKSAYINDYLMVSGYGYNSARGEGNRQQHYGRLNEKPWLPKDILERWDKNIPPIFSAETITADSLTESLKRMKNESLLKKYNYSALYAQFLGHHRDAFAKMMWFCLKNPVRLVRLLCGIIERNKKRKAYRLNPPDRTIYNEQMNVLELIDAQEKVMKQRDELRITKLTLIQ